jgi:Tol biopolymer transport system component
MAWVFGSLAVVTALTTVAVLNLGPADTIEKPVATSLSLLAPAQTAFIAGYTAPHLSVSPDGRTLAFVPMPIGGRALLWVRDLASPAPRQLAGTEGATFPFWSPDGRTIAFFADGQLKSIAVAGGAPHTICAAPDGRGGAWSPEGVIVFTPQLDGPLFRVDANGGQPVAATKLDDSRQEVSHRLPSFLPDGRRFLFLVQGGRPETSNVYVGRLDSLETDRLSVVASKAVYSAGHLLYRRDRSLVAHPFDADTLRLSGDPTTLTEVVATRSSVYGDMIFSEAAGTLAYWSGGQSTTRLTWLDRTGKPIEAVGTPAEHFSLSLSPDQKKVALEIIDPALQTGDIWVADVATGIKSRVTSGPGWDFGPKWSPDGSQVRFGSIRQGPANLYVKRSSGGETEQLFLKSSDFLGPTDWSADGHLFLFQNLTKYKVAALPLNGTQDSSFVLKSEYVEGDGTLSPDGKWLAYTSNESGSWDVYVQPYPSLDHKWRISPDGGSRPQWRRDSRELFYVGPDQQLMAVPVTADASFTAGAPVPLFPMRIIPLPPTQPRQQYAVSANGERFLVNTVLEPASPTPVTIVLNWSAAVEAKTR